MALKVYHNVKYSEALKRQRRCISERIRESTALVAGTGSENLRWAIQNTFHSVVTGKGNEKAGNGDVQHSQHVSSLVASLAALSGLGQGDAAIQKDLQYTIRR